MTFIVIKSFSIISYTRVYHHAYVSMVLVPHPGTTDGEVFMNF